MHTSNAAPMVVSTIQTPQRKEHYIVLGLSVTQIIIGGLCFILQLVLFSLQSPVSFIGQGIWAGVFFCLTGIFGIVSSKTKSSRYIVTFLVLTITSVVLTGGLFFVSWGEILAVSFDYYYSKSDRGANVTSISGVLMLLAVFQAVVAIVSAAFSCHGLCGGNQNQNQVVVAGRVKYVRGPDGQQQMVILPSTSTEQGWYTPKNLLELCSYIRRTNERLGTDVTSYFYNPATTKKSGGT